MFIWYRLRAPSGGIGQHLALIRQSQRMQCNFGDHFALSIPKQSGELMQKGNIDSLHGCWRNPKFLQQTGYRNGIGHVIRFVFYVIRSRNRLFIFASVVCLPGRCGC
jgi:hypothetical protein